jgi:pimeloyl-ACP methyl ester carboxylesterase
MTTCTFSTLAADDTGADDGRPPLVLLHGLTFDRHSWGPVIEAVRARDPLRRVVALDLPGHGESPAQPPHDLDRVADLVHDALDAAEIASPVLVGHSMSGALTVVYAGRFPTSAVVSVDQPPAIAGFANLVRGLEPQLRGPAFDPIWQDVFAASFHTELLPPATRDLVAATSRPERDLVLGYWQQILERPVAEVEALVNRSLDDLARRGVPYLLVLGSEPPPGVVELLRAHVPTARTVVWPGTGHFPHLARPHEFADLVSRFAAGLPLPEGARQ